MNLLLLRALLVISFLAVGACSSDDASVDDDPLALDDPESCSVGEFDVAEMLFTESDRQWYCSVATAGSTTEDEVYFRRDGQAEMTRFREVFWNRSLADQTIRVASPFITPFVIRDISSSNTVLMFDLVRESGAVETYDCVLVAREAQASEVLFPGLL